MTSVTQYRKLSKTVRTAAGLSGTPYPIVPVAGTQAPRLQGRSYYWTTPSGLTEVRHPNAYGWPTLYHGSTLRIEVGRGWLFANGLGGLEEHPRGYVCPPDSSLPASTQAAPADGQRVVFTSEGGFRIEPQA